MPTTKSHHLGSVGLAGLEQDWSRIGAESWSK